MSSPWVTFTVDAETRSVAREAAAVLAAELELDDAVAPYRDACWSGVPDDRPTLHLDDVSGIPFLVDIAGVEEYQHRARVRAGDGDFFAASTPPAAGYESYCDATLRMGTPELLLADPDKNKLAVADGCLRGPIFDRLVAAARQHDGLNVHPYMGIDDVWTLAAALHTASERPVAVIAPPPPVTWIANDKQTFGRLVDLVLGASWLVETHTTIEPEAMARALRLLAHRHDRVGLKRTRCASAMGNRVFARAEITASSDVELHALVRAFLDKTEWPAGEEVLAVAWESTDLSPSTQLWIPPLGSGQPILEGIYEQILEGPQKVFVGSRPSGLPGPVNEALARAAVTVATALQSLGYVGRCSFDHLVVGDPHGEFRVLFVECNGRWGGTSTPMSLIDRLRPGPRPPYRAQDFVAEALVGVPFAEILARVGDQLFDPRTGEGRFVFYNVGPLAGSGKLDVIAFGATQAEAEAALSDQLPSLLRAG